MGVIHPRLGFVGAESFTKFWFLVHNVGSRYARKSVKGSKSWILPSSKKKLEPKNGSLDWRPGPGKGGQKTQKHPRTCDVPHREPETQNETCFFFKVN